MDNFHITKDGDEWKFKREGSNRSIKKAGTKDDVILQMRDYMKTHEGSVKIHKQDGQFQEERTYPRSIDPRKTKG